MSTVNRRTAVKAAAGATVAVPVLAACAADDTAAIDTPVNEDSADDAASEDSGSEGSDGSSGAAETIKVTDIPEGGGKIYADAKVVVTQPEVGVFKAFSAVCTHQGCTVTGVAATIDCACHASSFSISDGSVTAGPATAALPEKTVTVSGDTITVA